MTLSSINPDWLAKKYFDDALVAYQKALAATGGEIKRHFLIGNHIIQLCFAGSSLLPLLTPALQHLAKSDKPETALKILLWDYESTGIAIPPPPWDVADVVDRGQTWRFANHNLKISYSPHNASYFLLNLEQNLGIYHTTGRNYVSQHDCGAPLLQIFKWWFDHHEALILHAGAVGKPGGGVLFSGKSGSGKSTTALACLDAGFTYIGDDFCLLENFTKPYAYSLYCSGKVNLERMEWFPSLKNELSPHKFRDAEKALFFFCPNRLSQLTARFPIKAILSPKISITEESKLTPVSPAQALISLAPSTILQFRSTENHLIKAMSKLVRQVPCFDLSIGKNLSTIPDVISTLLDE